MGREVTRDELGLICERARKQKKVVVSTNGCFDILHVGHLRILTQAREMGDLLVVGINSDDSVKRLKGKDRPINGESDRAEMLAGLACVDYVCVFEEDTPVELLKVIRPDVHVKGGDYKPAELAETPVVESQGGRMVIVDLVPGRSTTSVVAKIRYDT